MCTNTRGVDCPGGCVDIDRRRRSRAGANAPAGRYIVVLKIAKPNQGIAAVRKAGGKILNVNKLGIATVTSSNSKFDLQLRGQARSSGVAHDAWFRNKVEKPMRFAARATVLPSPATENATCAALFGVPARDRARPARRVPVGHAGDRRNVGRLVRRQPGRRCTDRRHRHGHRPHPPGPDAEPRRGHVVLVHLRDDAHVAAGGAGAGRRLLEQGRGPGLQRPRHAHGRNDRLGDQRPGHLGVAPRATIVALKAGTAEGYLAIR